jgi:putative glutamine amidotransferase
MRTSRPVIGLTVGIEGNGYFSIRPEYVRAVEKAGGTPVLLAPAPAAEVAARLAAVDGLILTGGDDVDPALYGEPAHPTSKWTRERDTFELAAVREALERDMPVLAICRGQQVLNVALGGTLVQDIPDQRPEAGAHKLKGVPRWEVAHEVEVTAGTRLRAIVGADVVGVNSFHHQAVRDVGRGLVVSARSRDGIIEGVELPDRRFVVGIQWHPEAMWNQEPDHQELFRALVGA